jgi:uncharacterized membrane protein YkoI
MAKNLTLPCALLAAVLMSLPASAQDGGIPPSEAVMIAVGAAQGAEPLDVKRRGDVYVVKLRQGGNVIRVLVDAQTGNVVSIE